MIFEMIDITSVVDQGDCAYHLGAKGWPYFTLRYIDDHEAQLNLRMTDSEGNEETFIVEIRRTS